MTTIILDIAALVSGALICFIVERCNRATCIDCGKVLRGGEGDLIARECGIALCLLCAGRRRTDNGGRDGL